MSCFSNVFQDGEELLIDYSDRLTGEISGEMGGPKKTWREIPLHTDGLLWSRPWRGPMCWAALDQFCESLALNEQHKLSRFRAISRSKCHTLHCWCPLAHLLCTLNPGHIWAWTTHSQMVHSMLIHPQMPHERVGKRRHFHLDRQETQQCATAMSQCSLLGLGEVAKELFCFLPIDATQQHELRWQVSLVVDNISLWQLLPPLTSCGPLACDPGSLSTLLCFRPLVGLFGNEDVDLRKMVDSDWAFPSFAFWNYELDAGKSICQVSSCSPMICQAPVAAFAVYPFAPCGCKRLVHKHRRFLLDPNKKSYGKISHEIWQKIGSAKEKNRLKCQFLFEKNWCDLSSCPKRWPATIQNPNDFSCEVLLWLADLPLTDRGSCSPKKGPTSYSFFFGGEWNSWTLIHWGFSHIFVARMHINSQAVFYWEVPTFGRSMRPSAAP